jgi:hypothetical protein
MELNTNSTQSSVEVIPYQPESGVLWSWEIGSEAELLFSNLDLSSDVIDDESVPFLIEQHRTQDTPQRKKRWFNL